MYKPSTFAGIKHGNDHDNLRDQQEGQHDAEGGKSLLQPAQQ